MKPPNQDHASDRVIGLHHGHPGGFLHPIGAYLLRPPFPAKGTIMGIKCVLPTRQFSGQWILVVVDARCWHICNQINTTTEHQHAPKTHIHKKPIPLISTVMKEGGCSGNVLQGLNCIRRQAFPCTTILH
jgi:hypothetical protein